MTAAMCCPSAPCRLHRLALLVALFAAAACSSADRHAQSDPTTRETQALSRSTLTSDDGVVLLEVLAQGQPSLRKDDELYVLTVPIGAAQPVECVIATNYQPLMEVLTSTFTKIPEPAERRVFAIEPLVLLDRPALYVALGFVKPESNTAGMRKFEIFTVDGIGSVLCQHDGVGHRETFRRVVEGLAGSLRVTVPAAARPTSADLVRSTVPTYQEISVLRVGTVPLGVEEDRRYSLEDGRAVTYRRTFELSPHGEPLTLAARDFSELEVSDPDGQVAFSSVYQARSDDGVAWDRHLWTLTRVKDGYEVAEVGAQGAPRRIADARALPGNVQRHHLVRENLLEGTRDAISFPTWEPPQSTWRDLTYTRLAPSAPDEHRLQRTVGDLTQVLFYDSSLCWIRAEPADPAVPLGAERIFSRGNCKSTERRRAGPAAARPRTSDAASDWTRRAVRP